MPSKANRSITTGHDFVSDFARDLWLQSKKSVAVEQQLSLYHKCIDDGRHGGDEYENYVLAVLLQSGARLNQHLAPLLKNKTNQPNIRFDLPESIVMTRFDGLDAALVKQTTVPTLYVPTNRKFPFVDFLLVHPGKGKKKNKVELFQSTVASEHQPTMSTVAKVLDKLDQKLSVSRLIWVGPLEQGINKWQSIKDGTRTDYDSIPQYSWVLGNCKSLNEADN